MNPALPTVVVPALGNAAGLDACLASLDQTLPAGSAVFVVDDALLPPPVVTLVRDWCSRSMLSAIYLRGEQPRSFAACLAAALAAVGDGDSVLFGTGAVATPGWLQQLSRTADAHPRAATLGTWSNRAELCSFPRFGEHNPAPEFPETVSEAAIGLSGGELPSLPAATGPCLFLRGAVLRQMGGIDADTFSGWHALDDFCRRAAAMGWSNALCVSVFIVDGGGDDAFAGASGSDLDRLLARWPDYQESVARFILSDPLRPMRERLQSRITELERSGPQRDLFN